MSWYRRGSASYDKKTYFDPLAIVLASSSVTVSLSARCMMLFPSIHNVSLLFLGALIAVSHIRGVAGMYDISLPLDPAGPLKVTLDYGLATTWPWPQNVSLTTAKCNWQYSSHIVFANRVGDSDESDPPISDGQLWYGISNGAEPVGMAALAWGNEIILASSMKGVGSFSYDFLNGDTPVGRSLQQCQIVWRDNISPGQNPNKLHKNRGNCAELLAAHLYYKNNQFDLQDQKARMGTWLNLADGWVKKDPCGTTEEDVWGCNLFTANQGLRTLDTNTPSEPYTLASLAGGPTIHEQIRLCGGQPRFFIG
ncbi:hypothetical protein COH20_011942 [Aspergillus flavus]|nr:hypothetical protein COH20_011942 [Aspergillus flavus]RAQ81655.1 hypothetical protein COH21_009219 [Aspergillus flavus]